MNKIKNSMRLAKIFAFALSVVIFCFPTVAMAQGFSNYGDLTAFSVDIDQNGHFEFEVPGITVNEPETIDTAITVFKDITGLGLIEELRITKDNGEPVLDCPRFVVENTEDILPYCAYGPVTLEPGVYTYSAIGDYFQSTGKDKFAIDLFKS